MADEQDAPDDYQALANAFRALWDFVTTELGWEYFRAEMLQDESQRSLTMANARMLEKYLDGLRAEVPVVDECLSRSQNME